jgi:hypothetical protein
MKNFYINKDNEINYENNKSGIIVNERRIENLLNKGNIPSENLYQIIKDYVIDNNISHLELFKRIDSEVCNNMKSYKDINYEDLRMVLPYQISKLSNGKYIFINRDYNPIFTFNKKTTNIWEDFLLNSFEMETEDELDRTYFFNDGNPPFNSMKNLKSYLKRVNKTLNIK